MIADTPSTCPARCFLAPHSNPLNVTGDVAEEMLADDGDLDDRNPTCSASHVGPPMEMLLIKLSLLHSSAEVMVDSLVTCTPRACGRVSFLTEQVQAFAGAQQLPPPQSEGARPMSTEGSKTAASSEWAFRMMTGSRQPS